MLRRFQPVCIKEALISVDELHKNILFIYPSSNPHWHGTFNSVTPLHYRYVLPFRYSFTAQPRQVLMLSVVVASSVADTTTDGTTCGQGRRDGEHN
jgi:hypothetical protein